MITLTFHSSLLSLTNNIKIHNFAVKSPSDLVSGLSILFPKLVNPHIKLLFMDLNTKKLLSERELLRDKFNEETTELVAIPTIGGAGGKAGMLALAAVLIAASFIPGLQGLTFLGLSLTSAMLSIGVNLAIGTLMSLIVKKPKNPNESVDEDTRENGLFSAQRITTSADQTVPLTYGLTRVTGHHINAHVRTIEHDKITDVKVIENVY